MRSFQWRRAAIAGIVAGIVATAFEIVLWWASSEPLPAILFRDARLAAAILMGSRALPPPSTFDASIMLIATLVHFALSIVYGLMLGAIISGMGTRVGMLRDLLVGALFGLTLYTVNMYGFTLLFSWFAVTRDWITAAAHAVFGMVVAIGYGTRRGWIARPHRPGRNRPAPGPP